ncbi:MAG: protein translocase subunit SecD [Phycisphaerae bacterium]
MAQRLWSRFLLIGLIVGIASLALWHYYPPKGGIDLAGGTDLLYELQLTPEQKLDLTLPTRVIDTLRRRVDPQGIKNINWRVVGGNRIQIQMPLADEATRKARKAYREAVEALRQNVIRASDLVPAMNASGPQRYAELDKVLPATSPRRALAERLCRAWDARRDAEMAADSYKNDPTKLPTAVLEAIEKTPREYDAALKALLATNLKVDEYIDKLTLAADPRNKQAAEKLAEFTAPFTRDYPEIKPLLDAVAVSYAAINKLSDRGFDDPQELMRLLRGSGVLEFRIAVKASDNEISQQGIMSALEHLQKNGPKQSATFGSARVRWFEADAKNAPDLHLQPELISSQWGGKWYVLLYDDATRSLVHDPARRQDWKLASARPYYDPQSGMMVMFRFDQSGTIEFGNITRMNVKRPMAIVLDDAIMSAPNIQDAIMTGSGQITFGSASRSPEQVRLEAENLVKILEAGSLPAALAPDPISVQTISPQLGRDNIAAGLRSSLIAVVAVMIFMAVYYSLTGMFANVALFVNLLLVLAIMAIFQGTWTMPGIAGLVLTLGMAVDANVLINERIREELHRGASLNLAVRQGYDRVFWTIFDGHVTTALTAIVLIFVGSEDVKGFGVTLVYGLSCSMFTSLYITRTLILAAIKWGILKHIETIMPMQMARFIFGFGWLRGRWGFLHAIELTRFDWIGKRKVFWTISAVLSVLGIVAFLARGRDKFDTEFNGGTQVTMRLREDLPPNKQLKIADVRQRVTEMATGKFADLSQATVYEVGEDGKTFTIVSTLADSAELKIKDSYLEALAQKFQDVLEIMPALRFEGYELSGARYLPQVLERKIVVPIKADSLDRVVPGMVPLNPRDNLLTDYLGGVATVLRDIQPPESARKLEQRIRDVRQNADRKTGYRDFKVIPTRWAPGQDNLVVDAVVVAAEHTIPYSLDANRWEAEVASSEWQVIYNAMTTQTQFTGVTSFDPQVAANAKEQALVAIIISLLLILIYVWIRFGGLRHGIGALLSLAHDALMAVGMTAVAGWIVMEGSPLKAVGEFLLIQDFKINLTMIAAYLTIVGYSVNDTIVIFDRIRENRGRLHLPMTREMINDSINQCFGRTIWTTFTVIMVVLILYIWGGDALRGFSYAMLIGCITGVYSTLAIASPALLSVRELTKKSNQKVTDLVKVD